MRPTVGSSRCQTVETITINISRHLTSTIHRALTLEQFWSSIWWTTTERIELSSNLELVAEAKVSNLDVQVVVKQKIFCLSTTRNSPSSTLTELYRDRLSADNKIKCSVMTSCATLQNLMFLQS